MLRGTYLGVKTIKEKKAMITTKVATSWREEVVNGQVSLFVKDYTYDLCTVPKCNIFHNYKKRFFTEIKQKKIDMRNRKYSFLVYASNTD